MQSPIPLSYMWHTVNSTIHTQVTLAISVNQAIFTGQVVALPFVVIKQKPSLAFTPTPQFHVPPSLSGQTGAIHAFSQVIK